MWELTLDRVLQVEWRVERRDAETGRMMRTVFAGPNAEQRARDYCNWLNGKGTEAHDRPIDPSKAARFIS